MIRAKPVGRNGAALKYDLISAMGAHALSLGKTDQRRMLRLITLITARYNWARDELAVGQREIARLWSCTDRTVKRELAVLKLRGWLVQKRASARGRVAEYGLDTDRILLDTRPAWAAVGPDFETRLERPSPDVVPFPGAAVRVAAPDVSDKTDWSLARALLHSRDPLLYGAWLQALRDGGRSGGRLTLIAPSRFHAAYVQTHLTRLIETACAEIDSDIARVDIIA